MPVRTSPYASDQTHTIDHATSPEPTGYRITHTFQHCDEDVPHGDYGMPREQTIQWIDVDGWEDIATLLDTLMLHTGSGFTVGFTIDALVGTCPQCGEATTANGGHILGFCAESNER